MWASVEVLAAAGVVCMCFLLCAGFWKRRPLRLDFAARDKRQQMRNDTYHKGALPPVSPLTRRPPSPAGFVYQCAAAKPPPSPHTRAPHTPAEAIYENVGSLMSTTSTARAYQDDNIYCNYSKYEEDYIVPDGSSEDLGMAV